MENHRCRICSKSFPSGRSLGGHMRSHIQFHSTEAGTKKKKLVWPAGGSGESPKKMGRLSELGDHIPASSAGAIERKKCRECGRMFPSSKALFGHMRCHSQKISRPSCLAVEGREKDQEEDEEGSWSLKKLSQGSMSDDNASPADSRWSHRMKLESTVIQAAAAAAAAAGSSITAYDQEQADVAIALMMLSRDVGGFWAPSTESSDKHSLVLVDGELKQQSESGDSDCEHFEEEDAEAAAEDSGDEPKRYKTLHLGEFGEKRVWLDEKGKYLNAQGSKLVRTKPILESAHQCTSCNRTFHSYQALGGHRASHKRIRGCCLPKPCASSGGTEDYIEQLKLENEASTACPSNLSRTHECSICGKTFFSGQALGGHKRSHVVPNAAGSSQSDDVVAATAASAEVKVPELLDLNFPAPMDEESSDEKTWRTCESIEFGREQPLVDFI